MARKASFRPSSKGRKRSKTQTVDKVLIAEACARRSTKHRPRKLPRWLRERAGGSLTAEIATGLDFPKNLKEYALIPHCGGCMFTRKQLMSRIIEAQEAGVPITNYGVAIAQLNGILERVTEMFAKRLRQAPRPFHEKGVRCLTPALFSMFAWYPYIYVVYNGPNPAELPVCKECRITPPPKEHGISYEEASAAPQKPDNLHPVALRFRDRIADRLTLNTGAMKKALSMSQLSRRKYLLQINSFFSRPLNVSLTMSNDSLLKLLLTREGDHLGDRKYLAQLQNYLHAYQKQYGYDSVFLISTRTHRYYHFNGLDRVLTPDNRENTWYYNFLKDKADYYLNVDNDEAAGDEITVFVNCKIKDSDGAIMGVVGVGMRVRNLQELLRSYDRQYGLNAMLVDEEGTIQISSEETGDNRASLFDSPHYAASRGSVLGEKKKPQILWTKDGSNEIFVAARYTGTEMASAGREGRGADTPAVRAAVPARVCRDPANHRADTIHHQLAHYPL
ncbi:MAG: cache domain-containing protein [Cloacibacillus evryensis]